MPNELFLLNNAGEDLILALTALMNQIEEQQKILIVLDSVM